MLRAGDVAVAISASGRSVDLLRSVDHALETGADVIGITALGSPLAARCTVALELQIEESVGGYAPTSPRLAQLAVVEVLAAGVALRQNPERLARLQRHSESVRGRSVPAIELDPQRRRTMPKAIRLYEHGR